VGGLTARTYPVHYRYTSFMETIDNVNLEDAPPETLPQCPYCKEDLNTIWVKTSGLGFKGQKEILMCPHCRVFLGYNAWKR